MGEDRGQQDSLSEVTQVFRAMPSRFKKGVAARKISYYFSIDDEKWTVFVSPDSCEVSEGKAVEDADCFLKTSAQIFMGTVKGEYTPSFMDLMTGKIKTNNPALLQTFKDIFGD
jgi:putative sterol carrier protein